MRNVAHLCNASLPGNALMRRFATIKEIGINLADKGNLKWLRVQIVRRQPVDWHCDELNL